MRLIAINFCTALIYIVIVNMHWQDTIITDIPNAETFKIPLISTEFDDVCKISDTHTTGLKSVFMISRTRFSHLFTH